MADAASWVGHVAEVARDDVDVQVEDGLACRLADVDADVEAVGPVALLDDGLCFVDGSSESGLLVLRGLEPGGDVPPRDDEEVAGRDGEGVP